MIGRLDKISCNMILYDDSSLMKVWHVRPGQEDHPGFEWLWTCLYWRVLQKGRGDDGDGDGDYDNDDDENDSGWWFSQLVSLLHAWGGWHDWLQGLHEACRQQNDSNRKTSPKLINYSHIETCENQKVTHFQDHRLGGTLVIVILTLIRFLWVWGMGWQCHSHGTELRWGCQKKSVFTVLYTTKVEVGEPDYYDFVEKNNVFRNRLVVASLGPRLLLS